MDIRMFKISYNLVLVNGNSTKEFEVDRGQRQGNLVSPFLNRLSLVLVSHHLLPRILVNLHLGSI